MSMLIHSMILAAGMTCLYFAYLQYQKAAQLLSTGIITTATVIELIPEQGDNGNMYRPKFEFNNKEHKPVQFTGKISSSPPAWNKGETTLVVYDQLQPGEARILSYWDMHRYTILLAILASPLLVIGIGYFLFRFSLRDIR